MLYKNKIEYKLIKIILLLMPFHYLLSERLLSGSSLDNFWRDLLLLLLLMSILFGGKGKLLLGRAGKSIIIADSVVLIFLIISPNFGLALNISRTYIVPSLIYFIIVNINISNEQVIKWFKVIFMTAVVVSIYGLFQAFILGDSFLIKLGYPHSGGYLSSSYYINGFLGKQRVTGTLVSPNICGVFLAISLFLIIFLEKLTLRRKIMLGFPILVAFICTLSRSSIIAFIFTITIFKLLKYKDSHKHLKLVLRVKYVIIGLICILVFGIAVLYLDQQYLNGLVGRMLLASSKMSDLSAVKHLEDLLTPMNTIFSHPFGLGFGNNGPKVYAYNTNANMVESSIYLSIYDFGIIGGIFFVFPYFKAIQLGIKKSNIYMRYALGIGVFLLFTYILLPNIQEYEPLFYFYFILGIANNKKLDDELKKMQTNKLRTWGGDNYVKKEDIVDIASSSL